MRLVGMTVCFLATLWFLGFGLKNAILFSTSGYGHKTMTLAEENKALLAALLAFVEFFFAFVLYKLGRWIGRVGQPAEDEE